MPPHSPFEMPNVIRQSSARPHFRSHWDIVPAELVEHNDHFAFWIGTRELKAANCSGSFRTVRALQQEGVTHTERFVGGRRNTRNENQPAAGDDERARYSEQSSLHRSHFIILVPMTAMKRRIGRA